MYNAAQLWFRDAQLLRDVQVCYSIVVLIRIRRRRRFFAALAKKIIRKREETFE